MFHKWKKTWQHGKTCKMTDNAKRRTLFCCGNSTFWSRQRWYSDRVQKHKKNKRKQGRGREVENEAEMAKKREMKNTSKCFFGESRISLCQFPFHPEDDKQHPQGRGRKQHHPKEEGGRQHHARGGREGVGSSTTENEEEQHTNTQNKDGLRAAPPTRRGGKQHHQKEGIPLMFWHVFLNNFHFFEFLNLVWQLRVNLEVWRKVNFLTKMKVLKLNLKFNVV